MASVATEVEPHVERHGGAFEIGGQLRKRRRVHDGARGAGVDGMDGGGGVTLDATVGSSFCSARDATAIGARVGSERSGSDSDLDDCRGGSSRGGSSRGAGATSRTGGGVFAGGVGVGCGGRATGGVGGAGIDVVPRGLPSAATAGTRFTMYVFDSCSFSVLTARTRSAMNATCPSAERVRPATGSGVM